MRFNLNQQDLQEALNFCQGVIERRSTLPILSNILLEAKGKKLTISATDLDLIFIHQIQDVEIIEEGKNFNISNCGMHALDTMRMESGFLHWGHDISPEENQYQAGLEFTISYKKQIDFIGKQALEKIKKNKPDRKFSMLVLKENKPGKPLLLHDEPIYLGDKIIGRTTSGNYSFNYKKNLAFGYIQNKKINRKSTDQEFYIEIEKIKYAASLLEKPLKDTDFKTIQINQFD